MNLLLVAQSSRMLAQSAHRAGLKACAIDCFADADTRRYAECCLALAPDPQGVDEAQWLEAADRLAPKTQETDLIYGSGIDTRPRLVEALARGRTLLGNTPAILEQVNNPRRFFALLARLGIPYPETRFTPPDNLEGWLVKPRCGEGGKGVGFAAKIRPPPAESYYQRHIVGEALSVLFLADGKSARVIGFNTQWTSSHDSEQPFMFAGAVNRTGLSHAQRSRLEHYVESLSSALGLVGLNSLDFMVEDGISRVLELNPRPSATMALYDEDFDGGLLKAHIAACRGEPLPRIDIHGPVRATRLVYAPKTITVRDGFRWPEGCADLPYPPALVAAGQPLCTLTAEGGSIREVEDLLQRRERELTSGLMTTFTY